MRIALEVIRLEADEIDQLAHPLGLIGLARARITERLGDDRGNGHARVQRRIGILEDHLHAAAIGGQRLFAEVGDILPVEENLAVRRLIQADEAAADRRFAAAALADEAEGFALLNGKAHVVHGLEQPFGLAAERAADGEIHFKPAGFYNRAHSRFPSQTMRGAPSSSSRQRAQCVCESRVISGRALLQMFMAYGQRATNGQPGGGAIRSGGEPGIGISLRFSPDFCGMERSSPHV